MKQHKIIELIRKRYKKINTAYLSMCQQFDEDNIHLFRVEVKKLKALLHLLSFAKGGNLVRKIPRNLEKYYQLAGRIRTYQLQVQAVSQQISAKEKETVKTYITLLREHVNYLTQFAQRQGAGKHMFDKGEKRLTATLPQRLTQKNIVKFARNAVQPLFEASFPESRLHQVRKGMKDVQYALPMVKKSAAAVALETIALSPKKVKSLTTLIGQYLDSGTQLQIIHSDGDLLEQGTDTQLFMTTLEDKWLTERRTTRQQLDKLLHKDGVRHIKPEENV